MDQALLGATETAQSPATPQEDNLSQYGALDKDAEEEKHKKDQRLLQNKLDIDRMTAELKMYEKNVETEEGKEDWERVFKRFKEKQFVKRACGLVENTARELYIDGRSCENVTVDTILAQPKLAEVVGALTPKEGAQSWYEVIKVTAQKVDDRVDALEKLQEETKKRDRAAQATVLTTLMSLIVSVANGMTEDQQMAKMISNVAPILLTLLLAFKTIMETNHDKDMQEGKKTYLVEDYKSAMYDISRFANEGADLLGKGPDGGTEESKKDLEEAEPNSPKP